MTYSASAHVKCQHCWKDVSFYHNGGPEEVTEWLYTTLPQQGWFRRRLSLYDTSMGPWFCGLECYYACSSEVDPPPDVHFQEYCKEKEKNIEPYLFLSAVFFFLILCFLFIIGS